MKLALTYGQIYGEVREASISMNNKQMDESDVSASVVSPADYTPYILQSLTKSSTVSTSIDANAAIITTHLPPDTLSAESI